MSEPPRFSALALASFAALGLTLAALGLFGAPASATTVGGLSTVASGPFGLVGGRLFTPMFETNNAGEAAPGPGPPVTEMATYLQSFAAARHSQRTQMLDASTVGSAPPALAIGGTRVATAWVGSHGFQSALVPAGGAAVRSSTPIPASGKVTGYAVAIDPSGARSVLWLDSLGVRLQSVSATGVAAAPLTLAPHPSAFFSLTADERGGWWAVWIAGARVVAADVLAAGGSSPAIDLAAAPAHSTIGARRLHPRPWTAVADGAGGLWVGLPSGLLRVEPTGVSERRVGRNLALAEGDRRTALAEEARAGAIEVRQLGHPGRALRLRGLGSLLDLAYDPAKQTTDLLTDDARGRVELTTLSRRGRVASKRVRGCPPAGAGELVAAGGLVGVACAGRPFEAENVETGGDFESGRDVRYYLLRDGRRLRGGSFFEGLHAY